MKRSLMGFFYMQIATCSFLTALLLFEPFVKWLNIQEATQAQIYLPTWLVLNLIVAFVLVFVKGYVMLIDEIEQWVESRQQGKKHDKNP